MSGRGAALVTGAGRRIGRALALESARCGHDVAVHFRHSRAEAEEVAAEIRSLGRKAEVVQADLLDEAQVRALAGEAASAVGPLTLLVNNASIFEDDRAGSLHRDGWALHMEVNLRAPIVLAEAFAKALPDSAQGLVVNILVQRVWKPNPQFFSYSLSKHALWDATRMLAQAFAPRIRVNGIGPGPTLPSIHQTPEEFAAEAGKVLLERRATPEAIARALRYLIEAELVTGQMIAVDGGQHLAWRTPDIVGD
jgi:NAD(P)-dependent dehydrogenase (short-subunit alcohol dehydrogenase family)